MLFPKKPQILYAPMLATFGGGSANGFRASGGGFGAVQTYRIFMVGGGGGAARRNDNTSNGWDYNGGGPGGYSEIRFDMPSGVEATVIVGGGGSSLHFSNQGGFGGGGSASGYTSTTTNFSSASQYTSTGGGRSEVSIPDFSFIAIVGGGGGSGWGDIGGHGGGVGQEGGSGIDIYYSGGNTTLSSNNQNAGAGGTLTAGGIAGGRNGQGGQTGNAGSQYQGGDVTGNSGPTYYGYPGGAGGGGYYGGGSGGSNDGAGGGPGGGGSGYWTYDSNITNATHPNISTPNVTIFGNSSFNPNNNLSTYGGYWGTNSVRPVPIGWSSSPYASLGTYGTGGIGYQNGSTSQADSSGMQGQVIIKNNTNNAIIANLTTAGSHTVTFPKI